VVNGTLHNFSNDFDNGETVTVTIIPFNTDGDAVGCTAESFTIVAATPVPDCTTLIAPADTDTNVAVDLASISWNAVTNATGYRVTVDGSASNLNDETNLVVNGTSYNFLNEFDNGETVTVTIVPFNTNGDAVGCTSESFTIVVAAPVPDCTSLIAPADTDTDVAVDLAAISWNAVTDATGYRITIDGSTSDLNDETDFVVNGTSHPFANDFDNGETVTVTIIPFNTNGDAVGCTSESFTIVAATPVSNCTSLIAPVNGATDIPVATEIIWNEVTGADGYLITVTTESNDIIFPETDLGLLTSFDLDENLPFSTTIIVNITPYNSNGESVGCSVSQFTTVEQDTSNDLPDCTAINLPSNRATDIAVDTEIRWNAVGNIDGYVLNIGTTDGGRDIVDNFDVGLTNSFTLLEDLPFNQEIFVTVLPYRGTLRAENCASQSFATVTEQEEEEDKTLYGISPNGDNVNDYWVIDGIEDSPDNIVSIYNRWGDMVFQVQGYNNGSNAFDGTANEKTKMGANELPSGTYFFNIEVTGEHNLKKLQGYLVIKR